MAGDWIKMRIGLVRDPDVFKISKLVGISRRETVGLLHEFWCWTNENSTDGKNIDMNAEEIDELFSCPQFADALRTVGWLSGRNNALIVPHYERHNGFSAKSRCDAAERKRKSRMSQKNVTDVTKSCDKNVTIEKRREENKDTDIHSAGEPACVGKSELQKRLEKLLRRRETTPWDVKEGRAFKANQRAIEATSEEDWQRLEVFYAAPQSETYSRKNLETLLNHWNGEVDRAVVWKGTEKQKQKNEQSKQKLSELL